MMISFAKELHYLGISNLSYPSATGGHRGWCKSLRFSVREYAKESVELNRAERYRLRHLTGCCAAANLVHNASDGKQRVKLARKDIHEKACSKLFHAGQQD